MSPITYDEMRTGCYDPKARLEDMDINHVEASLCFPTFPRFCGQTFTEAKDRELGLACVTAYNDWMVEEWCGDSGGRLIPLPIIPLWDAELAAAEVRRNAARGVRAVCFSEIPAAPRSAVDPHRLLGPVLRRVRRHRHRREHAHRLELANAVDLRPTRRRPWPPRLSFNNSMASMSDFLFSGVLVRFPKLKLAYSEGQIGWIPYILERVDNVWQEHRAWGGVQRPHPRAARAPTTSARCTAASSATTSGCTRSKPSVSTTSLSRPTTPTPTRRGPTPKKVAIEMMGHLPPEVIRKIVRGNAISMLSLVARRIVSAMPLDLAALVDPAHTVLVTQECQVGVIGESSPLTELKAAAEPIIGPLGALAAAARAAGVPVVHCVAWRREDGRGSNENARLFKAMPKLGMKIAPGYGGRRGHPRARRAGRSRRSVVSTVSARWAAPTSTRWFATWVRRRSSASACRSTSG